MWNEKLVKKLPWLHMNPKLPPMLSVLSDRSSIFEGMCSIATSVCTHNQGVGGHLLTPPEGQRGWLIACLSQVCLLLSPLQR